MLNWLARVNQKMLFHFPRVFPLISDRSVWHNGNHPRSPLSLTQNEDEHGAIVLENTVKNSRSTLTMILLVLKLKTTIIFLFSQEQHRSDRVLSILQCRVKCF